MQPAFQAELAQHFEDMQAAFVDMCLGQIEVRRERLKSADAWAMFGLTEVLPKGLALMALQRPSVRQSERKCSREPKRAEKKQWDLSSDNSF